MGDEVPEDKKPDDEAATSDEAAWAPLPARRRLRGGRGGFFRDAPSERDEADEPQPTPGNDEPEDRRR
jgi:hypothetical protein